MSFTAPFCISNSKFRQDLDVTTKNQCVNYTHWIIVLDFVSQARQFYWGCKTHLWDENKPIWSIYTREIDFEFSQMHSQPFSILEQSSSIALKSKLMLWCVLSYFFPSCVTLVLFPVSGDTDILPPCWQSLSSGKSSCVACSLCWPSAASLLSLTTNGNHQERLRAHQDH